MCTYYLCSSSNTCTSLSVVSICIFSGKVWSASVYSLSWCSSFVWSFLYFVCLLCCQECPLCFRLTQLHCFFSLSESSSNKMNCDMEERSRLLFVIWWQMFHPDMTFTLNWLSIKYEESVNRYNQWIIFYIVLKDRLLLFIPCAVSGTSTANSENSYPQNILILRWKGAYEYNYKTCPPNLPQKWKIPPIRCSRI